MDLRKRERVIGVENGFVVLRRWSREKHRDNRTPPLENHVIISGSIHTATSTAEMWGLPNKSGGGVFN
jgi:hypothetical protein